MIGRKYTVHVTGSLFIGALIFYSYSCNPPPLSEVLRISRNITQDPACMVKFFNIEAPELPQNTNPISINDPAILGTPASNVSTTAVPYTGLTKVF